VVTVDRVDGGGLSRVPRLRAGSNTGVWDNDLVETAFLNRGGVRGKLDKLDVSPAVDHIDAAVIIKKEREIMVNAVKDRALPWPVLYISGPVDISLFCGIGGKAYVVEAIMIPEAAGPGALPISILPVSESQLVRVIEYIIDVINNLPVYQVFRS